MKPKHAALQQTIGYQFEEPAACACADHRSWVWKIMSVLSLLEMDLLTLSWQSSYFFTIPISMRSLSRLRSKLVSKGVSRCSPSASSWARYYWVLRAKGWPPPSEYHGGYCRGAGRRYISGRWIWRASEIVASWFVPMLPRLISTRREMPRPVCRNGCRKTVTHCQPMRS